MNRFLKSSLLLFSGVLLYLATLGISWAADVRLVTCQAEASGVEGLKVVQAKFDFEMSSRLEDLLKKGISLYFTTEFDLKKTRRYWWDEPVIKTSYEWRLSYHALTKRYRLSKNSLYYNFSTLKEALALDKVVRNWAITDTLHFEKGTQYVATIRFRLDESKLPKLFQATPLKTEDWTLDSGWRACALKVVGES